MIVLRNALIPFKPYSAITIGHIVLLRKEVKLTPTLLRHETIHWHQSRELLIVGFYVLYLIEWLFRLLGVLYRNYFPLKTSSTRPTLQQSLQQAYLRISFEREAYAHQNHPTYLHTRPMWAFRHFWLHEKPKQKPRA